ncbi:hypothetical protein KFK09_001396 [Dendrobium nobile]|uniref:Uncharacterized protein n=1 Tax=Dendrobium nobile TaxID=94219 RepID=A0A8T3C511_DENNO|nr:hypothetical protein KFK09_001396 [Dendrobium nobile]
MQEEKSKQSGQGNSEWKTELPATGNCVDSSRETEWTTEKLNSRHEKKPSSHQFKGKNRSSTISKRNNPQIITNQTLRSRINTSKNLRAPSPTLSSVIFHHRSYKIKLHRVQNIKKKLKKIIK